MSVSIKCPACHDVKLVGQSGAGLHMCKVCCGPDADQFAFEILTRTIRDLQRANAYERAEGYAYAAQEFRPMRLEKPHTEDCRCWQCKR